MPQSQRSFGIRTLSPRCARLAPRLSLASGRHPPRASLLPCVYCVASLGVISAISLLALGTTIIGLIRQGPATHWSVRPWCP